MPQSAHGPHVIMPVCVLWIRRSFGAGVHASTQMLKLTNTLTGKQEIFEPLDGQTVRMYTCGPTVYNFVHIGNLRTFVWEDILRRHLRSEERRVGKECRS